MKRRDAIGTAFAVVLAVLLWAPFLLARFLGIELGAALGVAVAAVLAVALAPSIGRTAGPQRGPRWPARLVGLVTLGFAYLLFNTCLREGPAGGLYSAGGGCEDMGMHATLANAFLRSPDRVRYPTYPIFPGWRLGYPFLADFSAATIMALGTSIGPAMLLTSWLALAALMTNAWALARRWLPPPGAAVALLLFLFGGNLGFVVFLRDLPALGLADTWLNDYANNFNYDLHYGNIVTAVLIPMRTSLFGAPLAVAVLAILSRRGRVNTRDRLTAGLLLGGLPLVNAHAFVVTSLVVGAFVLHAPRRLRSWWPAFALAAALALPQVWWIRGQTAVSENGFLVWANGLLSPSTLPWPAYWLWNGGVFIPLALLGWVTARSGLRIAMLPLFVVLPMAMAIWFQPNPFDNIKLLLFFHLGGAIVIADGCRRAMAGGHRAAVAIAVAICTASGALSWIREANIPCEMATAADRAFADSVLRWTTEDSVILTGQRYTHPVPFLTGRPIVLGFHNWLGQHGIPYLPRAADVRAIYSGTPEAAALLARHGVTDVVVGPPEREEFPDLDEGQFAAAAVSTTTSGAYTLYHLRTGADPQHAHRGTPSLDDLALPPTAR
jgi:hypothetical protein